MNVFFDAVLIFIFVFMLTYTKVIDISATNVIQQKILMFLAVSLCATLISICKTICNNHIVDMWKSINSGIIIGLLAFVGHTFMFDLFYMPQTSDLVKSMNNSISYEIILASMIAISITIGKELKYIFTIDDRDF